MQRLQQLPLTDAQLSMLTAMLDEQWQFRLEQVAQLSAAASAGPDPTPAQAEVRRTILYGARLALAEIRSARARLAAGTYGRCTSCAARLSLERLEILPHAAQCIGCHTATIEVRA